jgi:tetratricopeptide (TPR) repeat protein
LNVVIALISNSQFRLPHILKFIYGKQGDDHNLSSSGACRENKYDAQFYLCRGITMYHLGEYDRAIRDFGMALRINWRDENVVQWLDKAERARAEEAQSAAELTRAMVPARVQQDQHRSPAATRN